VGTALRALADPALATHGRVTPENPSSISSCCGPVQPTRAVLGAREIHCPSSACLLRHLTAEKLSAYLMRDGSPSGDQKGTQ
jgi:hypothetical protein